LFCLFYGLIWAKLGENEVQNIVICGWQVGAVMFVLHQILAPLTPLFTHKFWGGWCNKNGGRALIFWGFTLSCDYRRKSQ
ncbi:MAG TPA: hypothetical protein DCP22_06760, partial [Ruminococcaceae bacterium]|nr:hypothetical protein [Oscillospiraceae bacterium]